MSGGSRLGIDRREAWGLLFLLAAAALLLGRSLGTPSAGVRRGRLPVSSADLLARGFELGGQVFTSQPPLFLTVLDALNWVAGGSVAVLRGAALAVALGGHAGGLGAGAADRRPAGGVGGLGAAARSHPASSMPPRCVSADVPSVAVGTAALLAARLAPQPDRVGGGGRGAAWRRR